MKSTAITPRQARSDYDHELDRIRWLQNAPFWLVHIGAVVGIIMLGWSWSGFALAIGFYVLRMFGITGGYHRYFAHRAYKTSRPMQFVLAFLGVLAVQKGPLWWSSHHRRHHKYSDLPEDIHSPRQRGFLWSHFLWILVKRHQTADLSNIKDFEKFPELRWLDRNEQWVVVGFATSLALLLGAWGILWGFAVSTVLLWHLTFTINSLAHVWGKPRYETGDDSKNNLVLGVLTMGEGWHNNHHYYQRAANQGFFWWEVDFTYYILKTMQAVGLVWDVHAVPKHVRDRSVAPGRARLADPDRDAATEPDDSPVAAPEAVAAALAAASSGAPASPTVHEAA